MIFRMRSISAAGALVLLGAWAVESPAGVTRFEITPGTEGNTVRFESKAPVETVVGTSSAIRGWVEVDPSAVGDSAGVHVEVDLATLKTGIGLRDRHMRENHLETERYPQAIFRGARIVPAAGQPAGARRSLTTAPQTMEIAGEFELHGVRRALRLPVVLSLHEAEGRAILKIECHFQVGLADYGIARPQFLVMKLSDVQGISLSVTAMEVKP